jgi:hypothetical protein
MSDGVGSGFSLGAGGQTSSRDEIWDRWLVFYKNCYCMFLPVLKVVFERDEACRGARTWHLLSLPLI